MKQRARNQAWNPGLGYLCAFILCFVPQSVLARMQDVSAASGGGHSATTATPRGQIVLPPEKTSPITMPLQ
jgi:hypothetical protein